MFDAFSLLALGFLLGVRHALDPDHVVAVTAIVTRRSSLRHAAGVGALWGLGHSLTVLVVGGVVVWFRLAVSDTMAQSLELGVAVMLIVLGVGNLRGQGAAPTHPSARPLAVGMVHGLAGSAPIALLVVATVADPRVALGYLALFGLGTLGAMTGLTLAMALPLQALSDRVRQARRWLMVGSGLASVALGLWLAVRLVHHLGVWRRGGA